MKLLQASLVALLGISLASCGIFKKNTSLSSSGALNYAGTAGIKNVNQLLLSMTYVTGTSPNDTYTTNGVTTRLGDQYATIAPFLSGDGSAASVNSAMLLTITGMAGGVCTVFLKNEAAAETATPGSSRADGGVKFTQGPAALDAATITRVINQYSNLFWGRAPTAAEITALTTAITSAISAVGPVSGGGSVQSSAVQNILLVPCTTMMSSLAFLSA